MTEGLLIYLTRKQVPALGFREVEFRYTGTESLRLGRSVKGARLWDFLGRLRPKAT